MCTKIVQFESGLKSHAEARPDAQETRILEKFESLLRNAERRHLKAFYAFAEGDTTRLSDFWCSATHVGFISSDRNLNPLVHQVLVSCPINK